MTSFINKIIKNFKLHKLLQKKQPAINDRLFFEYRRRDLNPHDRNDHRILSPACLPIPPLRHPWSEKRGSNPRPQPWQGCALPTELFSHYFFFFNSNALLNGTSSEMRCKCITFFFIFQQLSVLFHLIYSEPQQE